MDALLSRVETEENQQPVSTFYMGLDLGQATDYTALVIAQETWATKSIPNGLFETRLPEDQVKLDVIHLERFPLGTSYPRIVELVCKRVEHVRKVARGKGLASQDGDARVILGVDSTGVGRPICDLLYAAGLSLIPITITAGDAVNFVDGFCRVPKRDLVTAVQVLQQERKLRVAEQLPDAAVLVKEMENFRYRITTSANTTFDTWRENQHDDLLLALAVACWCERQGYGKTWLSHENVSLFD